MARNTATKIPGDLPDDADTYAEILGSLRAGILRIDSRGTVTYSNRAARGILGLEKSEFEGRPYSRLLFGVDNPQKDIRCGPIEFTLSEGERIHVDCEEIKTPDGRKVSIEIVCVPLVVSEEQKGAVLSFLDAGDRADVEKAVTRSLEEALEAARAKAAFLANMTHEIRTPLTGIIGVADLLAGTELTPQQSEYLQMLRTSTEFLHTIVNDTLDFSKLEAGAFESRREEFVLLELLVRSIDPFRALAEKKGLTLEAYLSEDLPAIIVSDRRSIRQILNNLLSNAVKFSTSGTVTVSAEIGRREELVRFSVCDDGPGINEEERDKLFKRFSQAGTDGPGGSGLGLAISRRLVMLLGGEIDFENRESGGARFWFEIPYKTVVASTSEPAGDEVKAELGTEVKILVVEDNPVNRRVMDEMLAQLGLEADSVDDGSKAVESCRETKYGIVFMDCQMPGMDGYAATKEIRKTGTGAPKIIGFTASASDEVRENCFAAGMDEVLSKPFTKKDLVAVLDAGGVAAKAPEILDLDQDIIQHSLSEIIDQNTLQRLDAVESDTPGGFVAEIVSVFVEHARGKLVDLRRLVDREDEDAKRIAHNLKGSASNIGLTELAELFERAEDSIGDSGWSEIRDLLHRAEKEFGRVEKALTEFVEGKGNDSEEGSSSR